MPIKFNPGAVEVKTEVAIPEAEEMSEPEEEAEDDLDDFEDLDDLEDEELAEDFYLGVQALAKMIAREVAAELLKATETPKKGSRK